MLIVRKDFPANTLPEFVAYAKQNHAKMQYGSAGAGSGVHVCSILLNMAMGTDITHVPYRGAGPAMQDLIAGQIDLMIDQTSNALPQVRAGKVRAYAVTSPARSSAAPDIPTVDEAGLPGFYASVWFGMWAPKGTPKEIITRLNGVLAEAFTKPEVQSSLAEKGLTLVPREQQTPEALRAYQKEEADRWWPIMKAANIKGE